MDKSEEVQPEQIEDYCRQLGLQLRDEQENMSVDDASQMNILGSTSAVLGENSNENGQPIPPGHAKLAEKDKTNFECKNCDKTFANSRQFLKHKCVTKTEGEKLKSSKGKKRGRKPRIKKGETATEGISVEVDTDAVTLNALNATSEKVELKTVSEVEEQGPHLSDHTYIKDEDKNLNQCAENTPDDDKTIRCDSCQLLAEIDPQSTNKIPCAKCQELAANPSLKLTDEAETNAVETKKRKYSFKSEKKNCPHCDKGFHSQKRYDKHLTICKLNLVCSFCNKDFSKHGRMAYAQYQTHYYTHVAMKPFTCDICSRGFIRKADLDRHKIIHTDNYSSHRCTKCGAVFASPENLEKHVQKHDRLPLGCEKCGQQFARQASLDKHIVLCQTETSCEVCGKVFKCLSKNIKSRYQEHMFIHTGERPYKCQFCERGFRDRSTKRKHERTHTGEKPYPCTICERAFSQLRLLRNHVRTHTGEKPYMCELCPLKFAKSCNLKYHMRVHTKEKPYTCGICFKSFTQSGTYHKHMRRHKDRSEKEIATTMIQFQAEVESTPEGEIIPEEQGIAPQEEGIGNASIENDSETMPDGNLVSETIGLVVDPVDGNSNMVLEVNLENDAGQGISQVCSESVNNPVASISEMPTISGEEITIIVSDSDDVAAALATIDVDQISSILASCS